MTRKINLIGKRFGRLIILSKSERKDKRGYHYWKCKCDCGKEKEINECNFLYKKTISCGCFREEQLIKSIRKLDSDVAIDLLYLKYKHQAARRNIVFNLSKEDFTNLIFNNCYYCNELPSNSFNNYRKKNHANHSIILYNGIDRLDSTKGYEKGNVVSCCQVCNYAKRSLSEVQFKEWIKKVYINLYHKTTDMTPGQLVDLLITTDMKCWWSQEKLMDSSLSVEQRAEEATRTQELNAKRTRLIRTIDTVLDYTEDTNTEKTYDKEGKK